LEEEVVGLFDRFRGPLLRYLVGCGLAVADGEEVIQEVFLSLFQHLQAGKPRENLPGWLFRVAHNLALKRRHRIRRDSEARAEAAAESKALDREPSPEEQVVMTQIQKRLLAVVRALPEQDRRCLSLRAEGLRYRDIAEVLGISESRVSQIRSKALGRLRS